MRVRSYDELSMFLPHLLKVQLQEVVS